METSPLAYQHALYNMHHLPPSGGAKEDARVFKFYGPLLWLFRVFLRLTCGVEPIEVRRERALEHWVSTRNRSGRRYNRHNGLAACTGDISRLKVKAMIFRIFSRGLTPRQYQEKIARDCPVTITVGGVCHLHQLWRRACGMCSCRITDRFK